jgi:hypothetical protein
MSALICDGCFRPILESEWRIYRGWRFTGGPWDPPRQGDTTHTTPSCQHAYVARRLYGKRSQGGWSLMRIAREYGVSVLQVWRWVKGSNDLA